MFYDFDLVLAVVYNSGFWLECVVVSGSLLFSRRGGCAGCGGGVRIVYLFVRLLSWGSLGVCLCVGILMWV